MGVVGEGMGGAAMVDDHMHLMGWDMTEMGTKRNTVTRMKNHAHSVCTILHMHKVRGGDVFVQWEMYQRCLLL